MLLPLTLVACGEPGPVQQPARDTSARPALPDPSETSAPDTLLPVGAGPVGLAADGEGGAWVVLSGDDRVVHLTADGSEPDVTAEVPGTPLRAVVAGGALWVTAFRGEQVLRVDPATGEVTATTSTGAGPEGITAGFGSIWVVEQDAGTLARIDPAAAKVVDRGPIGVGARLVLAGRDALWVAQFAEDRVLRVDPRTLDVRRSARLCSGPQGMAEAGGKLWVACTFADKGVPVDVRTLAKGGPVDVPGLPDPVVADGDRVLVLAEEGPRLVVLDARSGEVLDETVLGEASALYDSANLDLVVSGDQVWATSHTEDGVHRVPVP
jgi:streptogramin lyase